MTRHLYSALYCLLLPLLLLRLLWRSRREPDYRRRWVERFGLFAAPGLAQPVWVHAVSVGELASVGPLLDDLLAGGWPVVVTTTTPSASRLLRQRYQNRVFHVYLPLDLPWCVNNFLRRVRPARLLLVEKELWPNLVQLTAASGCSVALVNGRMSADSRAHYDRLPALVSPMMGRLQTVAAQTEEDAAHFMALGCARDRVSVCGNLKYDVRVDEDLRQRSAALVEAWNCRSRPVMLAASIHPEEEALLIKAMDAVLDIHSDGLFILVPRHPVRARALLEEAQLAGLEPCLFSSGRAPGASCRCVVVDTLGDMMLLLGLARVAVVGGSFDGHGGHNLAEPAAWALPVISGPCLDNFAHSRDLLLRAGALSIASNSEELTAAMLELLVDELRRQELGMRAYEALARESGASDQTLELLGLGRVG